MTDPTCLYRFYDHDGALLYVGITTDPYVRFAQHQLSVWGALADLGRTRIDWFQTRAEAKIAETQAIKTEDPLYNVSESVRAREVQTRERAWTQLRVQVSRSRYTCSFVVSA